MTTDAEIELEEKTTLEIAAVIMAALEAWDGEALFSELEQAVESQGYNSQGDVIIGPEDLQELNIFLWSGASMHFARALSGLVESGMINARLVKLYVYMDRGNGYVPLAPTVDFDREGRQLKKKYDTPHWSPSIVVYGSAWEELRDSSSD